LIVAAGENNGANLAARAHHSHRSPVKDDADAPGVAHPYATLLVAFQDLLLLRFKNSLEGLPAVCGDGEPGRFER